MSSHSDLDFALVFGFGAGIVWFFQGFRVYRKYRVLADTPEVPLRAVAMGLVEVHGKAQPLDGKLVTSPVSRTPCLFYKVNIERYHRNSKGGGSWRHYKTDEDGASFYLDDGTGRVLVDAHGAELDLLQTCRHATGYSARTFQAVTSFFARKPALAPTAAVCALSDSALESYALSVSSMGGSGLANGLGNFMRTGAVGSWNLGGTSGPFRFTEYCILPGHWYDVTGTCAENPSPRDQHDRNMIMKGSNEPTFLISWRNERGIEGSLRRRAALHIFGGAALSVTCLAILLARFGWL